MKVRKAVIPAAGLGTRFLPATKAVPKEMPLIDTPSIQLVVEEAVRAGLTDILIVTARGKAAIEDHFDRSPELEAVLEGRDKFDELKQIREPPSSPRSTRCGSTRRGGSGMRSRSPKRTSAANRSPCCSATT